MIGASVSGGAALRGTGRPLFAAWVESEGAGGSGRLGPGGLAIRALGMSQHGHTRTELAGEGERIPMQLTLPCACASA